MSAANYTKSGAKATTPAKLDKKVFGVEVKNHDLLKSAYLAYLANGRENFAVAKKRGEVRGGGVKPWRQKGTGRARVGSSRNPVWRGGGAAFGPTGEENYSHKINTKAKRGALKQALTLAAKEDRIKIIESFEAKDGKVKPVVELLKKIDSGKNTLLIVSAKDESVTRATNNIQGVVVTRAKQLQVYNILNADSLVITKEALEIITEWLSTLSPQSSARTTEGSEK
jgi:large subunit ribosomal protein L4